jgi:hypothetical protein
MRSDPPPPPLPPPLHRTVFTQRAWDPAPCLLNIHLLLFVPSMPSRSDPKGKEASSVVVGIDAASAGDATRGSKVTPD